jgi:predicted phage-related endonuclease
MIKRQNIGPSHYSTILGLNKYKTIEELQSEIEIGFIRNDNANPAMSMGIEKESEVIKLYEKLKDKTVKQAHWIRSPNKFGRILAKADGLVDKDGGIEIKCHYAKERAIPSVPLYYLVQILGYLHLYKREWWDLISCCFDKEGKIGHYRIHRIYWKDYSKPWLEFWYPQIEDFIKEAKWS